MYFGYAQMWLLTFVPAGFVIVMVGFVAFSLIYAVGATRGKKAAQRYLQVWTWLFLGLLAADIAYAITSGQMSSFLALYGVTPLIEMGMLAFMCVFGMWFMAVSYVNSKADDETGAS